MACDCPWGEDDRTLFVLCLVVELESDEHRLLLPMGRGPATRSAWTYSWAARRGNHQRCAAVDFAHLFIFFSSSHVYNMARRILWSLMWVQQFW